MWCKKILVAYDGSAPSHRALEVMREIAAQNPAVEVVLVHVMRLFSSGSAAAGMDTVMVDDAMAIRQELEACPFGVMLQVAGAPAASKCIACGICVKACPMEVLEIRES